MANILGLGPLVADLKLLLGPYYQALRQLFILAAPVLNPGNRLFIFYSIAFVLIGFALYLWKENGTAFHFSNFMKFCFPRDILLHKSAIVDYKYYFVNGILIIIIRSAGLLLPTILVADSIDSFLKHTIGPVGPLSISFQDRLIYTIFVALALDMGFFVAHYIQHKVPLFWEFHKVHHSAKVLTPITNFRFHPVDAMLLSTLQSVALGCVTGTFIYLYDNNLDLITVLNISVVIFIFQITANLRHSHLWVTYGQYLSHIFISPAQHQIHHGSAPRHIDKNFGLIFALWDWIAGTLYVPKEQEEMSWGLTNNEEEEYMSVLSLYLVPFSKAGRLIKGARIFRFGA